MSEEAAAVWEELHEWRRLWGSGEIRPVGGLSGSELGPSFGWEQR